MQKLHKLAIALLAIVGIQGSAFAYRFSFTNKTDEHVTVRFQLAGDGAWFYLPLFPGKYIEKDFPWIHEKITNWEENRRAGFCMSTIQYIVAKKDARGQLIYRKDNPTLPETTDWEPITVRYVPTEKFNAVSRAADQMISGAANIGLSAAGKSEANTKGLGKGMGTSAGYSDCKNRHYNLVKDPETNELFLITLAE